MGRECSVFVDETGGQGGHSRYYAVTLVVHEQDSPLAEPVRLYEEALALHGLRDIPFHASPPMNGHGVYEGVDLKTRKKLFAAFFVFFRHLPVVYATFLYRRSEVGGPAEFSVRIRRDVVAFLFDQLGYFQGFDQVKIYYDDAQQIVSRALRKAFDYALSKDVPLFRKASPEDYRLAQAADFLCTMELAAKKYENGEQTATDEKFFGSPRAFKRNYLKAIRSKRIGA